MWAWLLIALWSPGLAWAGEPEMIGLADAMARGASATPGVRAAQASVDVAGAGVAAAKGAWYPTVVVTGDVEAWDSKIETSFAPPGTTLDCTGVEPPLDALCGALSTPVTIRDQVTASAGVRVVQPLTGLFETRADTRAAKAFAEAADDRVDAVAADAGMTAAQAWLDARGLEQQVEIAQAQVRSLEARVETARKTLEVHAATRSDVLLAEVALGRAREQRVRATALRDFAYRRLAVATGAPDASLRPDPGDTTEPRASAALPDAEALVGLAVAHRPELASLRARIAGSEEKTRSASLARVPDLSAIAAYTHTEGQGFVALPDTVFVGARLDWVAFAGGRKVAGLHAAQAQTAQARADLEQAADGIRLQVEGALARLVAAEATFEVATERVGQAEESLRAMEGRQAAGAATMTELLSAETDLVQARSSRASAGIEARRAELALTRAVGTDPWEAPQEPR